MTNEHRLKIGLALRGRKLSEEHRKNISIATRGQTNGFKKGHKFFGDISKENYFKKNSDPWNKGIPVSDEVKQKISRANKGKHTGDKCHFWKGGVTREQRLIRNYPEYKEWRKEVFERDGFTCRHKSLSGFLCSACRAGRDKDFSFHLSQN